ncbi:hypothetical protein, partial [Salmonella sp. s54412]
LEGLAARDKMGDREIVDKQEHKVILALLEKMELMATMAMLVQLERLERLVVLAKLVMQV